jgi:hypothetical protein
VHVLFTHSPAPLHVAPSLCAQVVVVLLHKPEAQTIPALEQPMCKASFGSAVPTASFGVHVSVERSQKLPVVQVAST